MSVMPRLSMERHRQRNKGGQYKGGNTNNPNPKENPNITNIPI
jgi:hypothetical protein